MARLLLLGEVSQPNHGPFRKAREVGAGLLGVTGRRDDPLDGVQEAADGAAGAVV
jgi:hypothetical protein